MLSAKWYKWSDIDSFNEWHDAIKQELGYPIANINSETKIEDGTFTYEYTTPIIVSENDIRATVFVENSEGLVESSSPYSNEVPTPFPWD